MKYKKTILILLVIAVFVYIDKRAMNKPKNEILETKIDQLSENSDSAIVVSGVDQEQIDKVFYIDGTTYATFRKANRDTPINSDGKTSGVLINENGSWNTLFKIEELENTSLNNPLHLWSDNKTMYLLISDANGENSGEGFGKIASINISTREWYVSDCFYLNLNSFSIKDSLDETLSSYLNQQNLYHSDDLSVFTDSFGNTIEHCTNFNID